MHAPPCNFISTVIIHVILTFMLWKLGIIERFQDFCSSSVSHGKNCETSTLKEGPAKT